MEYARRPLTSHKPIANNTDTRLSVAGASRAPRKLCAFYERAKVPELALERLSLHKGCLQHGVALERISLDKISLCVALRHISFLLGRLEWPCPERLSPIHKRVAHALRVRRARGLSCERGRGAGRCLLYAPTLAPARHTHFGRQP